MSNELHMKYFVLKPRGKDAFARASRAAMFRYSLFIREEDPEFSRQVWDWATNEHVDAEVEGETWPPVHWHPDFSTSPQPHPRPRKEPGHE